MRVAFPRLKQSPASEKGQGRRVAEAEVQPETAATESTPAENVGEDWEQAFVCSSHFRPLAKTQYLESVHDSHTLVIGITSLRLVSLTTVPASWNRCWESGCSARLTWFGRLSSSRLRVGIPWTPGWLGMLPKDLLCSPKPSLLSPEPSVTGR